MLSQTTEYALRAMACLALKPDELTPTPALARMAHVPPNYLAKVLQQLSGGGLITGRRGVGGGYKLSRDPSKISLLDIVNAIGEVKPIDCCPCAARSGSSSSQLCPLHARAAAAIGAVIEIYSNTSLNDLLNDPKPNGPVCSMHSPHCSDETEDVAPAPGAARS